MTTKDESGDALLSPFFQLDPFQEETSFEGYLENQDTCDKVVHIGFPTGDLIPGDKERLLNPIAEEEIIDKDESNISLDVLETDTKEANIYLIFQEQLNLTGSDPQSPGHVPTTENTEIDSQSSGLAVTTESTEINPQSPGPGVTKENNEIDLQSPGSICTTENTERVSLNSAEYLRPIEVTKPSDPGLETSNDKGKITLCA